jgi:hypothetical protein
MTPTMPSMTDERNAKRLWVREHRGLLKQIADRLGCTASAVNAVLHYNMPSKDCRIETALAKAGAPFMRERLAELFHARGMTRIEAAAKLRALGLKS